MMREQIARTFVLTSLLISGCLSTSLVILDAPVVYTDITASPFTPGFYSGTITGSHVLTVINQPDLRRQINDPYTIMIDAVGLPVLYNQQLFPNAAIETRFADLPVWLTVISLSINPNDIRADYRVTVLYTDSTAAIIELTGSATQTFLSAGPNAIRTSFDLAATDVDQIVRLSVRFSGILTQ